MNKSIAGIFSKTSSLLIGVLFIALGLLFFLKYDPAAYDVKATGTIVEIEEEYEYDGDENRLVCTAYIDYTADGVKYEHAAFPDYDSRMKVGDTVEFYYMSEDPTQIAGLGKDKAPYIGLAFAGVGLVFTAITVVGIIRRKAV